MTGIRRRCLRQAVRDQLAAAGETDPVLRVIADAFIAAHATLCKAAAELDAIIGKQADQHPVAQRLMTIPGVGPVVSLSFIALIDDLDIRIIDKQTGELLRRLTLDTTRRYQPQNTQKT